MAHDLKPIDGEILVMLTEGRNVPSNLADRLDVSRQWTTQRLQQLESADYVRNVGRGVYELQPEAIPPADRDRLGVAVDHDDRVDLDAVRDGIHAAMSALSGQGFDFDTARTELERVLEELEGTE